MAILQFGQLLALADFSPRILKLLQTEVGQKSSSWGVAENILNIAERLTGQGDFEKIINALKNNPELIVQFQQALLDMEREILFAEAEDRRHARDRDIALVAAGQSNRRADLMVIAAALGLVLCLLSLGFYHKALPGEAIGIISTVAGILGACLKDAFAFEFGSSRGSKNKDITNLIRDFRKPSKGQLRNSDGEEL